jgi:hypothetical protein
MENTDRPIPARAPRQRAEQQRAIDTVALVLKATILRLESGGGSPSQYQGHLR